MPSIIRTMTLSHEAIRRAFICWHLLSVVCRYFIIYGKHQGRVGVPVLVSLCLPCVLFCWPWLMDAPATKSACPSSAFFLLIHYALEVVGCGIPRDEDSCVSSWCLPVHLLSGPDCYYHLDKMSSELSPSRICTPGGCPNWLSNWWHSAYPTHFWPTWLLVQKHTSFQTFLKDWHWFSSIPAIHIRKQPMMSPCHCQTQTLHSKVP